LLDRSTSKALLARIEAAMSELSPSEARVAAAILDRPERVQTMAIAVLAKDAGVSEPTVARFCKSLGFSGLKDFKVALARSMAGGVPFVHGDVNIEDATVDIAAKVLNRAIATLIQVRDHVDSGSLDAAIVAIAAARRLEFYGQGNSGLVALDAQHKFFRLGMITAAYADPHVHAMSAALLGEQDVVVAISAGGRTADLIRTIEIARQAGATIVGITVGGSPLARLCHHVVATDVFEDPDVYSPMTSRLSHLALIDVIAVGVAMRLGPEIVGRLEKAKHTVREKRVAPSPSKQ
jgi:RpiR family carbohydrate utilization transcriptional regulator